MIVAIFAVLVFMLWNFERGYPKSILDETLKGACYVTTKPIVLLRSNASEVENRIYPLLPIPDGINHVYTEYVPGDILAEDGSEFYDLSNVIEIPIGTRFTLKDGFQDRTINSSSYYVYWMIPEGITLDSIYVFIPFPAFRTHEEMAQFPDDDLFERACDS